MNRALRRALIVFLASLAALGAAGGAAYFALLRDARFVTDAGAIRQPAKDAPLRDVLWTPPERLPPWINLGSDALSPHVAPDGQTLIVARAAPAGDLDLYTSKRTPSGWSALSPLASVNTDADEIGAAFSSDGSRLYFASNRAGGYGGFDIWMVSRSSGATWSKPVRLENSVNTRASEYAPAVSPDGSTLVFATDRRAAAPAPADIALPPEHADFNIFAGPLTQDGAPANKPAPLAALNSTSQEASPAFSPAGDFLYFASNRIGGLGGFDIYRSRVVRGAYQPPVLLARGVNTPADEIDPAVGLGGFSLLFSSNRNNDAGANGEPAKYDVFQSLTREVFIETVPAQAQVDWGQLLPWLLLLLLLALLLAVTAAAGGAAGRARLRRLSLLARCVIASLLVHAILLMAFTVWHVTTTLGQAGDRLQGVRVSLASPAGSEALFSQVRADLTSASASPARAAPLTEAQAFATAPDRLDRLETQVASQQQPLTPLAAPAAADASAALATDQQPTARMDSSLDAAAHAPQSSPAAVVDTLAPIVTDEMTLAAARAARRVIAASGAPAAVATTNEPPNEADLTAQLTPADTKSSALDNALLPDESQRVIDANPNVTAPDELQIAGNAAPAPLPPQRTTPAIPAAVSIAATDEPIAALTQHALASASERTNPLARAPRSAAPASQIRAEVAPSQERARPSLAEALTLPPSEDAADVDAALAPPPAAALMSSKRIAPASRVAIGAPPGGPSRAAPFAEARPKVEAALAPATSRTTTQSIQGISMTHAAAQATIAPITTNVELESSAQMAPVSRSAASRVTPEATIALRVDDAAIGVASAPPVPPLVALEQPSDSRQNERQQGAPGIATATPAARRAHMPVGLASANASTSASPLAQVAPQATPRIADRLSSARRVQPATSDEDAVRTQPLLPAGKPAFIAIGPAPKIAVATPTGRQAGAKSESETTTLAVAPGARGQPRRAHIDIHKDKQPRALEETGVAADAITTLAMAPTPANRPAAREQEQATDAPALRAISPIARTSLPLPAVALSPVIPDEQPLQIDPYTQRSLTARQAIVDRLGGSEETEESVAFALAWLAAQQQPDGRWDDELAFEDCEKCRRKTPLDSDVALTGLALLCFQAAGNTHMKDGPYRERVKKGVDWLLTRQSATGDLRSGETMYSHGIATIALAEAYGMTKDVRLRKPVERAVQFITESRNREAGGWRYEPGMAGDTSVLGWMVMAMMSAKRSGLDIPDNAFNAAQDWLDLVSTKRSRGLYAYQPGGPFTHSMTAEAMFVQQLLGADRTTQRMEQSTNFILTSLPDWEKRPSTYYWYYATLAMFQRQGKAWETWNKSLTNALLTSQRRDGLARGSWDPRDRWSAIGGRVYQTTMCTLSLEVYYRYLPLYVTEGRAKNGKNVDRRGKNAG